MRSQKAMRDVAPIALRLLLIFVVESSLALGRTCPKGCSCFQSTVRCDGMRFVSMPRVENDTTTLDLRHNQIVSIPSGYFRGFYRLHTLLLSNNRIVELKPDVFLGLKSLRHLYLSKNEIATLHAGMFRDLNKLVHLNLQFNNISVLQSDLFAGLRDLERLNMNDNRIRLIEPGVFDPLNNLEHLTLSDNRLACNCQLLWMRAFLFSVRDAQAECHVRSRQYRIKSLTNERLGCCSAEIVREPEDENVALGDPVLFRCFAVGCPSPRVTWAHNGIPVTLTGRKSVLKDGSLAISKTHPGDAGVYTCQAKNAKRTTTASAKLSYIGIHKKDRAPVLIVSPPATVSVSENASLTLSCSAQGHPEPKIVWHKEKKVLRNTYQSGDPSLKIKHVTQSDEGVYTCRASNRVGKATAHSQVAVNVRPTIVKPPSANLKYVVGETARLWCRVEGKPVPARTWWRDGRQLVSSARLDLSNDILLLRELDVDDTGKYECRAENSAGVAKQIFRLSVRVLTPPVFSRLPTDVVAAEGSTAVFQCRTTAPASVAWLKGEQGLRRGGRIEIDIARGTLVISGVTPSDEGAYVCLARNNDGVASTQANLAVHDQASPSRPTSPPSSQQPRTDDDDDERLTCFSVRNVTCDNMCYHRRYRTIDGTCNNLDRPHWGAARAPLHRLLTPIYDDRYNLPTGWKRAGDSPPHPSARLVSTRVISAHAVEPDPRYTLMLMQFGQFLDHDLSHSPTTACARRRGDCAAISSCFPIPVPRDDRRIGGGGGANACMSFARSTLACHTGTPSSPRQQVNQITSYIDASSIYGSDVETHGLIRNRTSRGLLNVGVEIAPGKYLLPYVDDATSSPVECLVANPAKDRCFLTGDKRGNEQIGLTAMHTIWLREHNRIARALGALNPRWNGDRIFQEARKIVVAELQHITYTEFLPKIVGEEAMRDDVGSYARYDPNVDASIANAFSTSAYRFGHTLIQPLFRRLNASFESIPAGDLMLRNAFFAPQRIRDEGGIDPIIRGLFATNGKLNTPTSVLNAELTEALFAFAHEIALDLGALNIQRGRDHGLPKYLAWRAFYNLSAPQSFDALRDVIRDDSVREKLEALYVRPDNVDLWVGGLVEDHLDASARVGPLFARIIADQFRRTRDGDRFWYERRGVFDSDQLLQIRKTTLARVLCDNGDDIARVQRDVFRNVKTLDDYEPCSAHPKVDLRFWSDCGDDQCTHEDCGGVVRSKRSSSNVESFVEASLKPVQMTQISINNRTSVVEEIVEKLTQYVGTLEATVNALQNKLNGVGRGGQCLLGGEVNVENGERVKLNDCLECFCKSGQLICERLVCPPATCQSPVKKRGECCAKC